MRNTFKSYLLFCLFLMIVFNAIVFSFRALPGYVVNYDMRFWVSWIFITTSFFVNFLCSRKVFFSENANKVFLSFPLISLSYSNAILMTIVGSICMLIPDFPVWITLILCVIVLAIGVTEITKASYAADAIEAIDNNIGSNTSFMKMLLIDVEALIANCPDNEIKKSLLTVRDIIKFSDPISNPALRTLEDSIRIKLDGLSNYIEEKDFINVDKESKALINLIDDRNKKLKLLK